MPKYLSELLKNNADVLKEAASDDASGVYGIENPERAESDAFDLHCVENPEVLLRLNSVVASVGRTLWPNVNSALNLLWRKLGANAGLSFVLPRITEESGKLKLPLVQFGGAFDALTGETLDGISHKMPDGKGLDVEFTWKRKADIGSFQVTAKIVPGSKPKKDNPDKKETPEANNPRNKDES